MHSFFCSLLSKTFKVFLFLKFSNYITLLQWTNYISPWIHCTVLALSLWKLELNIVSLRTHL